MFVIVKAKKCSDPVRWTNLLFVFAEYEEVHNSKVNVSEDHVIICLEREVALQLVRQMLVRGFNAHLYCP